MITSSVKELNDTKAKVARLEQALAKELASLPAAYGFDSLKAFVAAIKAASGKGRAGRPKKSVGPKSHKRATITDAVRAKVKALVKAGKTGSFIAKALGISLPSVQNIKKALGLVRPAKKTLPKRKARSVPATTRYAPKVKKKRVAQKKAVATAPKPNPATAETAPVPLT
jgi:hypothetical protein